MSPTKAKPSRSERRSQRRARSQPAPEAPPESDKDADSDAEADAEIVYTIDELAAKTKIPSRTIRFYQSSGVLPKPEKRGRIAYYSPRHIERLELVGKMQDRGLQMRAIKELVGQLDSGEVELGEWLGLEQQLSSPWVDDAPRVLDRAELDERLGTRRPGFIAELARGGLLEIQSEDAYLVHSPGLLQICARLDDLGVGVEVSVGASTQLQKHLAKAAGELATVFTDQLGEDRPSDPAALEQTFTELRAVSLDAVRLLFAREMEQVLRKQVETGAAVRVDAKGRRAKSKSKSKPKSKPKSKSKPSKRS